MKVSLDFSVKADVADSLENQMEKPSKEDLAREGAEEADELMIPRDPDQGSYSAKLMGKFFCGKNLITCLGKKQIYQTDT